MYVKRELEEKILSVIDTKEIIAIFGARQCGKTTMLMKMFSNNKNCNFISFEDRTLLRLFNENTDDFVTIHLLPFKILIIDEFQYASKGGEKLKYIYDLYPDKKIIITGSSSADLTIQAVKYLVGRIFIFYLFPFSVSEHFSYSLENGMIEVYNNYRKNIIEMLKRRDNKLPEIPTIVSNILNKNIEEIILYGNFPKVVTSKKIEVKKLVLKNIINTYLLREIRDILQLTEDDLIEKTAKYLALKTGTILQIENAANFLNISRRKVEHFIQILEKTFIIKNIPPFYTNKLLELSKAKKVFMQDSGFRNSLVDDFRNLEMRPDKGSLNENFVFSEFEKILFFPNLKKQISK
jgi:predicted AAA+ superfamily ATPase